jgi:hypothetical protein
MQEVQGNVSGSSYKLHVGGADDGGAVNDEKAATDILKREMGDYATITDGGNGIDLKVSNYADPLELTDYYEKMVIARDSMLREMSEE